MSVSILVVDDELDVAEPFRYGQKIDTITMTVGYLDPT